MRDPTTLTVRRITLADVEPERIAWLWYPRLPRGKVTILESEPGTGKSTLTLTIAAALSAGLTLPGTATLTPADVLVITYEDGLADTVVPRVLAAGGDVRRIHVVDGVQYGADAERPVTLPDDTSALRAQIEETQAQLVIIDPFGAALAGSHDAHRDQDVRRALAPLARVAEDTGAAILIVRHTRKSTGGPAIHAGMGSVGIAGAARVVLSVHRHPDDPDQRILAVTKCNIARHAPSLVWRLDSVPGTDCARVVWVGESPLTADELTATAHDEREDDGHGSDERSDWLRAVLAAGPLPARDVLRLARAEGYPERSLRRTARRIGVSIVRTGAGREHTATWSLDVTPATTPSVATVAGVAAVERDGRSTPATLSTAATPATPALLGDVAGVPDADGIVHHPDGTQELSPARIAAMLAARAGRNGATT